jgi:hypothetical protein
MSNEHWIHLSRGEEGMRPVIEAKGWGWMFASKEATDAMRAAAESEYAKQELMDRLNARLRGGAA